MDSDDGNDRIDDLERELQELKQQMHGESMPAPGIKGWLILHAIGNVVGSVVLGLMALGALVGGPPPLVTVIAVSVFAYILYYTIIFFQHKKSLPIHARAVCVLGGIFQLIHLGTGGFGTRLREEDYIFGIIGVMASVLWFVYYGVSKRVKVTFVKD